MSKTKSQSIKEKLTKPLAVYEVAPKPRNQNQRTSQFEPFPYRKTGLFSFARLRWLELFFWFAALFVAGGICGGFITAAFFRSRGW